MAETFRLRASKDGYAWGEQNVTVPDVPRADFFLHQACCVRLSDFFYIDEPYFNAGITVTSTPSTCSWSLSTGDDWITHITPTMGTGTSTIVLTLAPNTPATASRIGSILASWPGGSTRISVEEPPMTCPPWGPVAVPLGRVSYELGLGMGCWLNTTTTSDVTWLHVGMTHGGYRFLEVDFDANSGPQRIGHITMDGHGNGLYAQYTFVQAHP